MHRNSYDSDNTTLSPAGRLHQVEYALEAVKQGSASVGLRSKTHVILLALKRSTGELASYQKKLIRIDDHIGVAIAGLTSDARVLSNFMRTQAMSSRMLYNRPLPVNRIVNAIADKAQVNTQHYGKRPYGVGFLVAGHDSTGPHLYEFSPSGNCFEYYAMSIGARSQSAKTYLEAHFDQFPDCDLDTLIKHGLHALRDTLQQDKELTIANTSIGIVGIDNHPQTVPATDKTGSGDVRSEMTATGTTLLESSSSTTTAAAAPPVVESKSEPERFHKFTILEGDSLTRYLESMDSKEAIEKRMHPDEEASSSLSSGGAAAAAAAGVEGDASATTTTTGGEAMETD